MGKRIRLIFKNGVVQDVLYSAKIFSELTEKIGKDVKLDYKNYSVMAKELISVIYVPAEAEAAE